MKKVILTSVLTLLLAGNVMAGTKEEDSASIYNQYDVLNMPINNSNDTYVLPMKALEFDIDGNPVIILTDMYGNTHLISEQLQTGENYIVFFNTDDTIQKVKKSDYYFTYEKEFLVNDNIASARQVAKELSSK